MRNWNSKFYDLVRGFFYRFYSTYEELKLFKIIFNQCYIIGFYSTYEELKLFKIIFNQCYIIGFYSTYEELKLCKSHL